MSIQWKQHSESRFQATDPDNKLAADVYEIAAVWSFTVYDIPSNAVYAQGHNIADPLTAKEHAETALQAVARHKAYELDQSLPEPYSTLVGRIRASIDFALSECVQAVRDASQHGKAS